MIPYLLHVACLIALCYGFYRLLLARETFFQLNRWILIGAILMAFLLPLWQIPQQWTWRQAETAFLTIKPVEEPAAALAEEPTKTSSSIEEADPVVQNPAMEKTNDLASANETPLATSTPDNKETLTEKSPAVPATAKPLQLTFWSVLKYIYLIGLGILALNFLIQLISIAYQRYTLPTIQDGPFCIVEMDQDKPPFSFWNSLFINPAKYDWETYNQIIQHEKVHLAQRHSLDILLAEALIVLQWFNPLAWLYRKAIEDNLEYLTDATVLEAGVDRSAYQMNLLQVAVPSFPLSPANNYNQSTLKKRITMMNAKKSSLQTSWKYLFLLPILGLATVALNPIKTTAATTEANNETEEYFSFSGITNFEKSGIWSAVIEGDEICFTFNNSAKNNQNWWSSTQCFAKSEFANLPMGKDGEFQLKREAGTVTFTGRFDGDEGLGRFSFTESAAFRANLEKEGYKDIKEELMFHFALNNFNGEYLTFLKDRQLKPKSKDELAGVAFHLPTLPEFKKDLDEYKSLGYGDFKLKELIAMNIHDMNPEYIQSIRDAGFKDASFDELMAAKIHDVDPAYIKEMQGAGFGNLTLEEITQMSIHDVDTEFVKSLASSGFTNLNKDQVLQASIHDVNPEYIKELQAAGFKDLDLEKITQMSIHDVDADFVKELNQMGFTNLTDEQILQASIHDVSPKYLKELKDAGFKDLDLEKVIQFSIHDVSANFVKELNQMGFSNLTDEQILQASIHGVSPEYMKELKAAGFKDLSLEKIIQFSIHDVDTDFVKELNSMGFTNLTEEQILQASIHDVSPKYIKELKDAGFKDLSLEKVIQMSIHGVDAGFVKKLNDAGYTNLDEDQILQASIHGVDPNDLDGYKKLGFDNIPMDDLIQLHIHNVTPEFIQKAKAKGFDNLDLGEYVRLKIMGFDELGKRKGQREE